MTDTRLALTYANQFEAAAARGAEGADVGDRLRRLAREVRRDPELKAQVAAALTIMIEAIEGTDSTGRFAAKVSVLRDGLEMVVAA